MRADDIEGLDGIEGVLDDDNVDVVGLDLDADGEAAALLGGGETDDGGAAVEGGGMDADAATEDDSGEPVEVVMLEDDYALEETDDESVEPVEGLTDAGTDYLGEVAAEGSVPEDEADPTEEEAVAEDEAVVEEETVVEEAAIAEDAEPTPVRPEDGEVLDTIDTTGDGYADVRLIDTTDDGKADTVMGDLNDDGFQDINARDTDGNTTLDAGEGLENMELLTRGAVASDSIDMIERQRDDLDSDEDGVTNVQEHDLGMDTLNGDMDRDGVGDGAELDQVSNPDDYLSNQPIEDVAEHEAWEASIEAESWDAGAGYDAGGYDADYDAGYDAGADSGADYDATE